MSGERCLSLDRAQRAEQQRQNVHRSGGYVPGRSPNRSPPRRRVVQNAPSTPEIFSQNYEGCAPSYDMGDFGVDEQEAFERPPVFQYGNDCEEIAAMRAHEPQREHYTVRPPQIQDLPDEFLEAYDEPSFYDIPANSSFDEVVCTMATPPKPASTIDDVRKRIAAHIGPSDPEQGAADVVIDDVRKRMAAMIAASEAEPTIDMGPKIPPLPKNPREIPPHPKDPTDIVGMIRRAKAIARLRAIREAEAAAKAPKVNVPKVAVKVGGRWVHPPRKAPPPKKAPPKKPPVPPPARPGKIPPPKARPAPRKAGVPTSKVGTVPKKQKQCPPSPEHPPDYVPPEWAAAILRTRKLAGLKTKNPKLMPKPKTPLPPPPQICLPPAPPPPTPPTPTYESIRERVAAFKARAEASTAMLVQKPVPKKAITPKATIEEELDDFEALEQFYDAAPNQCPGEEVDDINMDNRIAALQRQLFQSPPRSPRAKTPPRAASPIFEMPAILRYQGLLNNRDIFAARGAFAQSPPSAECPMSEYEEDMPDWELSEPMETAGSPATPSQYCPPARSTPPQSGSRSATRVGTPVRSQSPYPPASSPICPSGFDDRFLQNIEMPDFNIDDVPEFAFSEDALADAGFMTDMDVSLGEISMPNFEDDISFDEYGLEDVSSPELCDLSISGSGMSLEPDYPLDMIEEDETDDGIVAQQKEKSPGFLTSMVHAVVHRIRNMFSPSRPTNDGNENECDGNENEFDEDENENEFDENCLNTSLPNLFETTPPPPPKLKTPPPKSQTPPCIDPNVPRPPTPDGPIIVPKHPKNPKDYLAIVKRAQAIHKKKLKEAAEAAAAAPPPTDKGKKKPEIKSSIPKRGPPPKIKGVGAKKKKKEEPPAKVYPPGEYSPKYAAAVAHARTLAGHKNMSKVLNPERHAKIAAAIAEKKRIREEELAAIEALPPVERMRTKMERMAKRKQGEPCPRPSIEALGALEAIRASLPLPEPPKRKWKPTSRLRADRRVNPKERVFRREFGRILIPTKRTVKKKGWKKLDVMSPLVEEKDLPENFMKFSPLKPREAQLRLQYLQEKAARTPICPQTPQRQAERSPCISPRTPQTTPVQYSPIKLQSPSTPRTEQTRREKITTQIGENGGQEIIREEVVETSTIENGEVHTSTRHVTTKTDEYGNVTCHVKKGKGVSGEEEAMPEDIDYIDPPDFMDTSDIPPPRDPSIPTPAEIIDRIRSDIQRKLNIALPTLPEVERSPSPPSPGPIDYPEDLPDEELFDMEIPEFEESPQREYPQARVFSPIEKDERMYAWGERPPPTPPPPRPPTPKARTPPPSEPVCPSPRSKSPEGPIVVPAHPKNPKDYAAMVRRAQAIQKRIKQREAAAAAEAALQPVAKPVKKVARAPISKWVAPIKIKNRKRMIIKKKPKVATPEPADKDDFDKYAKYVARARKLHGLKNKTAALNPEVAAQIEAKRIADEAAQAAYDALPENEKIKIRMEKLRRVPKRKRRVKPTADMIGTIAAIRANMPPIEEVLRAPSPKSPRASPQAECLPQSPSPPSPPRSPRTPEQRRPQQSPKAPVRRRDLSPTLSEPDDQEYSEEAWGESQDVCQPEQMLYDESFEMPDITPLRPSGTPKQIRSRTPSPQRVLPIPSSRDRSQSPRRVAEPSTECFADLSLDEFEALESEYGASESEAIGRARTPSPRQEHERFTDLSLDEFELLEAAYEANEGVTESNANFPCPVDASLDEFEALEARDTETSLNSNEAAEAEALAQAMAEADLYNYETPTRHERYFGKTLFPRSPSQTPKARSVYSSPICSPQRPQSPSPGAYVPAPSMRMLAEQNYFEEHGAFDDESILGNEIVRPFVTPKADALPGSIYYDQMQDFKVSTEQCVLDSSNLMPETPKNIQERFRRLKEAQERRLSSPRCEVEYDADSVSPTAGYSPVRLMSPSGAPCLGSVPEEEEVSSPATSAAEGDWLLDIDDEDSRKQIAPVRQFRDLEDMPFDELEYEDEPCLASTSFDKPMTPPPQPCDIINRIRSRVQEEQARRSPIQSPGMLEFPDDLPEEELFELSAPSLARTPPCTPPVRQRSPRVSLPMAWGETRPLTPKTPPRLPSPVRTATPPQDAYLEEECPAPRVPSPEGPIVVPPHPKNPKDYEAIVRRAQAIHKQKQRLAAELAAAAPPPAPPKKKGRVPISRWQGPPPKKIQKKPRKRLVLKKRNPPPVVKPVSDDDEDRECPTEPPPLPQNYAEPIARARLIHGLKNKTAALNPIVAAKLAAKKAAAEAAKAAFDALPENEKIKKRMERFRKKKRRVKPTIEQMAYLEALKLTGAFSQASPPPPPPRSLSPARISQTPRKVLPREICMTPRHNYSQRTKMDSSDLAEFEGLEQMEAQPEVCPSDPQDNEALAQRMADLEQQLFESEEAPPMGDVSLAEYEALEGIIAPPDQCPVQTESALDMGQAIADLQLEHLATPPKIDARERYRQLLAQKPYSPKSPVISPVKTPEIRYSPVRFPSSPFGAEEIKRAENSTTQVTRRGNNTIKEQVIEMSEIVNGELQHVTTHLTTTTDPNGNVTCQINESKRVSAKDTSFDVDDVEEPSFLDTTPLTPSERPRPRDIIERVGREMKAGKGKYRPEAPTGHLVELRTPPPRLPLPNQFTDEDLLDLSCPALPSSPPRSPVRTPVCTPRDRSPVRTPNISIPELFVATPPTPLPSPRSLRKRVPSPDGPIIVPDHPKDPKDYATMVRRARKIQQQKALEEAEQLAIWKAQADAAAALAAMPKKRVPISKWTAPPAKKPSKRKKLVMKKRGAAVPPKTPGKQVCPIEDDEEEPTGPPPLPDDYAEHVARARQIAGLKNKTAALNPRVAAKEAAKAEVARIALEAEAARQVPVKDYGDLMSKMQCMKEKGAVPRGQASIASAAYLNAIKGAMQVGQQLPASESPGTRYKRLKAERDRPQTPVECSPVRSPRLEDIPAYAPLRLDSPRLNDAYMDLGSIAEEVEDFDFNACGFEGLDELGELGEMEEPSFADISQSPLDQAQYIPETPPQTPTRIIRRIREKLQRQQAVECAPSPPCSPEVLEFPEDLPEEDIFELSAPSFARSPPRQQTPIRSPNMSLPKYFERTPSPKPPTPKPLTPGRSPPLLGICPGVRARTPEGRFIIPPHPEDPQDIAGIIRRTQLIQKLRAKKAAEKAAKAPAPSKKGVKGPAAGKPAAQPAFEPPRRNLPPPKKGKYFRKLVLKKKAAPVAEPVKRQSVLRDAVANARKLAGVKPKNPQKLQNPENRITEEPNIPAVVANIPPPCKTKKELLAAMKAAIPEGPADYKSIIERAALLKAYKSAGIQKEELTSRQLTAKQNLINRQQRQDRNRLLRDLERIRQKQAADNIPIEYGPTKTPPTARERLQILKSRIPTTPTDNQIPYSPVKTPDIADLVDLPQYNPIGLAQTPPYKFLDNVCIPDIGDVSIPFDVLDDYEPGEYDEEEEMDAANGMDFDMADRIEMLQNQMFNATEAETEDDFELAEEEAATSQDEYDMLEAEAAEQDLERREMLQDPNQSEFNMCRRIGQLQNQLLQSPRRAPKIEILSNRLLQPAGQRIPSSPRSAAAAVNAAIRAAEAAAREPDQQCETATTQQEYDEMMDQAQDMYEGMMDDFDEMERECQ